MVEALAPLTDALGSLSGESLGVCLRAAALHLVKRDGDIDAQGVVTALGKDGLDGSPKKLLGACGVLLKQAGAPGA